MKPFLAAVWRTVMYNICVLGMKGWVNSPVRASHSRCELKWVSLHQIKLNTWSAVGGLGRGSEGLHAWYFINNISKMGLLDKESYRWTFYIETHFFLHLFCHLRKIIQSTNFWYYETTLYIAFLETTANFACILFLVPSLYDFLICSFLISNRYYLCIIWLLLLCYFKSTAIAEKYIRFI